MYKERIELLSILSFIFFEKCYIIFIYILIFCVKKYIIYSIKDW